MADKDIFPCAYPEWDAKRVSSTFWSDFTIADAFGNDAIRDTFERAFREWRTNYSYLTELVCVLNHKIWQWHGRGDGEKAKLYDGLWRKADAYGLDNLKGTELQHFLAVLD